LLHKYLLYRLKRMAPPFGMLLSAEAGTLPTPRRSGLRRLPAIEATANRACVLACVRLTLKGLATLIAGMLFFCHCAFTSYPIFSADYKYKLAREVLQLPTGLAGILPAWRQSGSNSQMR